ncbi:MAG: hypothetical protein O7J95_12200 [Planctomycetota bacterium]|nr:hypothetical protein [Planctomycetota bacterium]
MNPFPQSSPAHEMFRRISAEVPTLDLGAGNAGPTDWTSELARFSDEELLGAAVAVPFMASAVRSGLLLRADLLEPSHEISQRIDTPTGSYWHGIMHRREGDFSNSKYWFRRVGAHPLFPELSKEALELAGHGEDPEIVTGGSWDPFRFVDVCESRLAAAHDEVKDALLELQELEIELLLRYSYREAVGQ